MDTKCTYWQSHFYGMSLYLICCHNKMMINLKQPPIAQIADFINISAFHKIGTPSVEAGPSDLFMH
jgi:hypothetical protein